MEIITASKQTGWVLMMFLHVLSVMVDTAVDITYRATSESVDCGIMMLVFRV